MTTKYEVTLRGGLTWEDDGEPAPVDPDAEMERTFDVTMRELVKLAGLLDPLMSGSVATGLFEVTVVVKADTEDAAAEIADSAIRSALHAAGVGTAVFDKVPRHLRLDCLDAEAEELIDA